LAVSDSKTGFRFFNVEGQEFEYEAGDRSVEHRLGRLLMSDQFAAELGRPSEAGSVIGQISIRATMQPIEVTEIVDGEASSDELPGLAPENGTTPWAGCCSGRSLGIGTVRLVCRELRSGLLWERIHVTSVSKTFTGLRTLRTITR
jgi:hypothetical protein